MKDFRDFWPIHLFFGTLLLLELLFLFAHDTGRL